ALEVNNAYTSGDEWRPQPLEKRGEIAHEF
ncbi:hypothetical protein DFR39_1051, partial [Roseateles asaccharophilus]